MSAMTHPRLVLTNANVIDCVGEQPIAGGSVVIERGRIREVLDGTHSADTRNADVIDLKGAYLLPGLWDVHIHPDYVAETGANMVDQTIAFGQRLMEALTEAGVVGVRCAGAAHFMDVAWKRAFDTGQYVGPRVFAAGHFLTSTGGHFLTSGHALECDGPYGFVRAIREQIKNGVDHVKLNLTGGIMGPVLGPPLAVVSPRRGARGGVRNLSRPRFSCDGACRQPRSGEDGRPAWRAQRRARLHHGSRVRRAALRQQHVVRT